MVHQKNSFKSADGIHDISYEVILPDGDAKGIVQISHGMCEYFGRYNDFGKYMASHGYIVCGNDHLGHGESVRSDDELGYFSPENGWKNVVSDLFTLTEIMKKAYPDLPYYLFGHSMGSFMARAYCIMHGEVLDGVIICGTGGGMPGIDKLISVVGTMKKIHGDTYRSEKVNKLAFGKYNKHITAPKSAYAWISRDDEIVEKYEKDGKCTFIFTLNGFENLMGALQYVSAPEWYELFPRSLPTFIISGDADPVGDYGKGPYKVYRLLSERGDNVRLKLYSGARHELLNETNRSEVYRDVLAFYDSLTEKQ